MQYQSTTLDKENGPWEVYGSPVSRHSVIQPDSQSRSSHGKVAHSRTGIRGLLIIVPAHSSTKNMWQKASLCEVLTKHIGS